MKLYTFFRATAPYRMRIALNLKGIAYEPEYVSLPNREHHEADYARVNPQRLLPALVDGETVLVQSLATMEYLEETHPEPPLLPQGAAARAYVRAIAQMVACEMHPLNNLRVLKYLENVLGHDEAVRQAWYGHWIAEGFTAIEAFLVERGLAGRYCHGDQVTMADVCLIPQVFNGQRFNCPLDDYPTIMSIFENCSALQPFADAHPDAQGDKI
jgi:maleylacetoacetate isomerase